MQHMESMQSAEKIMVTGTHGFVGARIMRKYPNAVAVPSELVRCAGTPLADFVQEHQPSVIINAAAISDIGTCERDHEASYASNVTLPLVLAGASKEIGAKLISFSSDQVYTGCTEAGPYSEDAPLPEPRNVYARHKLEAEHRVLDIDPNAVLLRATWMYDMPMYNHANRGSFIMNVLKSVMRREKIKASSNYRGITYVRQVVELLDAVAGLDGGVYNYGSENPLSMYDTTLELLKALGLEAFATELLEMTSDAPHNLWMDCEKIKKCGICFDTTAEGFYRLARDYFQNMI